MAGLVDQVDIQKSGQEDLEVGVIKLKEIVRGLKGPK